MSTENKILEFLYQETAIHFLLNPKEKDVMINATEMAKLFGKEVKDFNKLSSTNTFIKSCVISEENSLIELKKESDFLKAIKNSGTFMHEILALKFASWLDPKFEIWVYCRIKEILNAKNNKVAKVVSQKQQQISQREALIAKAIKENNTIALDLLKVEKEIRRSDYLQQKAVKDFTNQYKMSFQEN